MNRKNREWQKSDGMSSEIRECLESDSERVLEIWLGASIEAHDFIEPEYWHSKLEEMRDKYLPMSRNYLYQREGRVVGFVSMVDDFIAAMFVDPANKREGIGRMLMEHIKRGRKRVELTVFKENRGAVEFYKKAGFVVTQQGIEANTGHTELRMEYRAESII